VGRWAQARRRQSVLPTGGPAGPPPAPLLRIAANHLFQDAQGGDDTGGTLEVEFSDSEFGPFEQWDTAAWVAVKAWGSLGGFEGSYFRAKEYGNGLSYVGASEFSATVFFE
jgi:hypothetical protein